MFAELTSRQEDGVDLDVLVWRLTQPLLCVSTAVFGGGLGSRNWVFNAQVPSDYQRVDIDQHVSELATDLNLSGSGVGMLTAARVRRSQQSSDGNVDVEVTVGISHPTWAASDDSIENTPSTAGTINIVAFVPIRLEEAALINAVATATEAKSQALFDANIGATGTPSDAVTILCPLGGEIERFGGPRSLWGARLARAVHRAVLSGANEWTT
ncbi:MAG TPA: adenosylcobinamide amidohydrolase [Acidimicrobiales bacterium]